MRTIMAEKGLYSITHCLNSIMVYAFGNVVAHEPNGIRDSLNIINFWLNSIQYERTNKYVNDK